MEQHNDVGTKWDLACYRMEMAHDDLDCAKRMYEGKFYRFANNRAYYAIFHAVSALVNLIEEYIKTHR